MPFGTLGIHQPTSLLFLLLAYVTIPILSKPPKLGDYYNLTDYIYDGYKKEVRPVLDEAQYTNITISLSIFQLIDISEKDESMKMSALLDIQWIDEYLSWYEIDYGNISSVLVKQGSIWVPDIVVGNTVTTQTQLGYKDLQVRLNSNGSVDWEPTGVFQTSCDIDVTYYPFDTQVCSIVFTSAQSTPEELRILFKGNSSIDLNNFTQDSIWDILSCSANVRKSTSVKNSVSFNLQLRRRPTFYILNIILPLVILAMTSSLVFALPAESGEKMSLTITVLLAFAVYLTLVTDSMPKTSVQVSLLMVYILLLLALTAFSVVLSVFLLKLYHRPSHKPLGRKAAKMIILLQKLMCSADNPRQSVEVEVKRSSQDNNVSIVGQYKRQMTESNTISPCDNSQESDESSCRCECNTRTRRSSEVNPVSGQVAAETLSSFLFIVFVLLTVVSTIFCFDVLVVGGATQQEKTSLFSDTMLAEY